MKAHSGHKRLIGLCVEHLKYEVAQIRFRALRRSIRFANKIIQEGSLPRHPYISREPEKANKPPAHIAPSYHNFL